MNHLGRLAVNVCERELLPDAVLRRGIRYLVKHRLDELLTDDPGTAARHETAFMEQMRRAPIALVPEKANEQHYRLYLSTQQCRKLGRIVSARNHSGDQ